MAAARLSSENCISAGIFSFVYRISSDCVRKVPRDDDPQNVQAVRNEAAIYTLLGKDDRVAKWKSVGSDLEYVDIEWAVNGTLADYIKENMASDSRRLRLARQTIESIRFIHERGIIHSDICLRQFLMYEDCNARLSDFAASSFGGHEALGMENASHYMPRDPESPNTIKTDLFALGSTLYELMAKATPYFDKSDAEIENLYSQGRFPDTGNILCGAIISGCWENRYKSAGEALAAFDKLTEATALSS